jgi:hypothetical protein
MKCLFWNVGIMQQTQKYFNHEPRDTSTMTQPDQHLGFELPNETFLWQLPLLKLNNVQSCKSKTGRSVELPSENSLWQPPILKHNSIHKTVKTNTSQSPRTTKHHEKMIALIILHHHHHLNHWKMKARPPKNLLLVGRKQTKPQNRGGLVNMVLTRFSIVVS